jgi:hypothetical protein
LVESIGRPDKRGGGALLRRLLDLVGRRPPPRGPTRLAGQLPQQWHIRAFDRERSDGTGVMSGVSWRIVRETCTGLPIELGPA